MNYKRMEEDSLPQGTVGATPGAVSINASPADYTSPAANGVAKVSFADDSAEVERGTQNVPTGEFVDPGGDRYKEGDGSRDSLRVNLQKVLYHLGFRVVMLILILADLGITIASIVSSFERRKVGKPDVSYDVIALVFSLFFAVEICIRIFITGKERFFTWATHKWDIVDFAVIFGSLLIIFITLPLDAADVGDGFLPIVNTVRLLRVFRIIKVVLLIVQSRRARDATRMTISENKRRYMKDGFDLDLTYVTDHVIAMSFPSSGVMSVYRNPIEQVSKFFKAKYPGGYKIYNLCSEMCYDGDKYFDGMVERVMIDDHNVPSLQTMLDFVKDVERFRGQDRHKVIAIHCKGGKGRTGTMVAATLLYSRMFETAQDALDYFATRRTDLSVGKKYQGVQTPSQSRYVHYFARMLSEHGGVVPPEKIVTLTTITVTSLKGIGVGNGSDLTVVIFLDGREAFRAKFGTQDNCSTVFDETSGTIVATLPQPPALSGDVKVRFESNSNIPCDYDGCPWFFWFNTSYLEGDSLYIQRDDLDNPHKEKSWKLYPKTFGVGLSFQNAPADEFL